MESWEISEVLRSWLAAAAVSSVMQASGETLDLKHKKADESEKKASNRVEAANI